MKAWQKKLSGVYFPHSMQLEVYLFWDSRLKCPQELGREHKCEEPATNWRVATQPKDTQIQMFYKPCQGQANHVQGPHQPAVPSRTTTSSLGGTGEMEKEVFRSHSGGSGGNSGRYQATALNNKGCPAPNQKLPHWEALQTPPHHQLFLSPFTTSVHRQLSYNLSGGHLPSVQWFSSC